MTASIAIPVIDLAPITEQVPGAHAMIGARIKDACTRVGFFNVVNHGVSRSIIEAAFRESEEFFALPETLKNSVAVNTLYRGYTGIESRIGNDGFKLSGGREFYTIGHELPSDDPSVLAGEELCGPNPWPDFALGFRTAAYAFYEAVSLCACEIMRAVAVSLGIDRDFFVSKYHQPGTVCSFLHYPPLTPTETNTVSIPWHTDYGVITLLCQDDNGGLEAQVRDGGQCIAVAPVPCAIVVNVGDLLARWSNDRFVSTPHRVVNSSGRERYSIALFYNPKADSVVDPRELGVPPSEARYEPTTSGEYIRRRFADLYSKAA